MKIQDIIDYLEGLAPLTTQESYDNAGLICGQGAWLCTGAIICLDSIESVIDEAIAQQCNLVIAHHPIIFSGLKKINGKNYIERTIIKAIKNDIAIYAIHTNLDNAFDGVNGHIAERLGLSNLGLLAPISNLKKIMTYAPPDNAEAVRQAMFRAGAGHISNYEECSFNTVGIGTYKGNEWSNPVIGERGIRSEEPEIKIEMIFPKYLEQKIITALISAHIYEEVAYETIDISNPNPRTGAGMVGMLAKPMTEQVFLAFLKEKMGLSVIRHTEFLGKEIQKVAVCGGAGSFLLNQAMQAKADIFITADYKYHQFFDADGQIIIADIGHYESEQYTSQLLYKLIKEKFPIFAVRISDINTNPINYFS